jgi:hypothetical protein
MPVASARASEERAARGRDVADALGHAGHVHGGDGIAAADHREARAVGDGARDRDRARRERRLLEDAHRPVPDDGPRRLEHVGEPLHGPRPDVQAHQRLGDVADADRAARRAVDAVSHDGVHGQRQLHSPAPGGLERAARGFDAIGLDQRAPDRVAQRAQEGEGHAAADEQAVHLADQVLDERDLVRDLGAAEHGHQRPLRRFEDAAERGQLAQHQQARRRWLQVARDGGDGGVGAVRRREGVVDVAVGQLGELPGEAVVVLLFLGMEAQVLEQEHLARLQRLRLRPRGRADAVGRERDGPVQQLREAFAHRPQRVGGVRPALGAAQVRGEHDGGAGVERVPHGGNDGAQARVVGHGAAVQGRVEVGAKEDALAGQRQPLDRELGQLTASCR